MNFLKEFSLTREISVGPEHTPVVVAEIGLNHNNDEEIGKRTIAAAKKAGAHAVKFQSYKTEEFIDVSNPEAKILVDIFKKYELSETMHRRFQQTAFDEGLAFFSTPLCVSSLRLLLDLKVPAVKIASGDVTNRTLLMETAKSGLPVILSTGAADFFEVERAVSFLSQEGTDKLCLLHCVSLYPTPPEKTNLRTIETFKNLYKLPVGFSDHTAGSAAAAAAVALGACMIEKHFTLDHKLDGPDHGISADPEGLKSLCENVLTAWRMLGDGRKKPWPEETNGRFFGRRALYADAQGNAIALRPDLTQKDSRFLDSWETKKAALLEAIPGKPFRV
ncbi:N-acetyl neuraminic (sialic) acid synthetase [Leptospira gomenensis]|uniref:N-acetyl neuraminic (Sialic) acid synthetase n=1 Tax=Leptospira gomenensis TaxID=2484974 RepID=A0A5F1YH69_9LEPT|nr:N-acetylneuraminate synthase family protein [Leptospira gomenensis]TGK37547.1 N-acetyl neuraminic (sialic) acid synthetase [Leptospira gomenensis]TGK39447.1 N-acetyl neuraminic (sialic) acid synthetase [Leptospira gomenensis]TGK43131.1 N-acetyl neuraminic (sialic) acid synthetase [Leptospira gomenensis]TGK55040.1 N-acetyl neuraminic (sialic) acid synthetase [Leptospira gomenensis]